jgi:hypothetical protein
MIGPRDRAGRPRGLHTAPEDRHAPEQMSKVLKADIRESLEVDLEAASRRRS